MKALSIIGLVLSFVTMLIGVAIMDITCYDTSSNIFNVYFEGITVGSLVFATSAYFLAFSIVATVKAFKKKQQ